MNKSPFDRRNILEDIADSLGRNPADFYSDEGLQSKAMEVRELLNAFDRIRDAEDRRICIDFINSVVARQGMIAGGP